MKNLLLGLCAFLILTVSVQAEQIDLNARDAQPLITDSSTVWKTIELDAGSYTVTPFDNTANSGYTAWSPWDSDVKNGGNAWQNDYTIKTFENGTEWSTGSNSYFATQADAFNSAISTSFTLNTTGKVGFIIRDNQPIDNRGGISLLIELTDTSPVPEPATMMLFGVGLLCLSGISRRKK